MIASICRFGIFFAVVLTTLVSCSKNPLEKAQNAEQQGNYAGALQLYAGVLQSQTKTFTLPDKIKSQFIAAAAWEKEVAAYSGAIAATTTPTKLLAEIGTAIARCSTHVRRQNAIYKPKVEPLTEAEFQKKWLELFVPPGSTASATIRKLGATAFSRKLSIVTIISEGTYTYDGVLLSNGFAAATRYSLKPENTLYLLAAPGIALLSCRSEVAFNQGELWRSPVELMQIEVPAEPGLVTVKLHTQVWKK